MKDNDSIVYPSGNELESILNNNDLVMIEFSSTWCTPCKMLEPTIKELANEYSGKAIVGKIDIDKEEQLADEYDIRSIPTVIFFKDGGELERIVGLNNKEQYKDILDENL